MKRSRHELAVRNSVAWYEAMFAAHGLASQTDDRVWRSRDTPPPFHSNLVVLSPTTTTAEVEAYAAELDRRPRPTGWSLKDSYACLDLEPLGFSLLFQATWIWRGPVQPVADAPGSRPSWTRLGPRSSLAEWERAWAGDPRNGPELPRARQFPDSLLGSPDHAFFAGRVEGEIVAGGIANRSPGAVGLSNLFAPGELLEDTWRALATSTAAAFPGLPIVGYERGADLQAAADAGFETVGELRVWCRAS